MVVLRGYSSNHVYQTCHITTWDYRKISVVNEVIKKKQPKNTPILTKKFLDHEENWKKMLLLFWANYSKTAISLRYKMRSKCSKACLLLSPSFERGIFPTFSIGLVENNWLNINSISKDNIWRDWQRLPLRSLIHNEKCSVRDLMQL